MPVKKVPLTPRKCRICGAMYQPVRALQVACSPACRKENHRLACSESWARRYYKTRLAKLRAKKCPTCGKRFETAHPKQMCCSERCGEVLAEKKRAARLRAARRAALEPRACVGCGASVPRLVDGRISFMTRCGPCAVAFRKEKKRAYYAAEQAALRARDACPKKVLNTTCERCGMAFRQQRLGAQRLYCAPCAKIAWKWHSKKRTEEHKRNRNSQRRVQRAALHAGGKIKHRAAQTEEARKAAIEAIVAAEEARVALVRAETPELVREQTCNGCSKPFATVRKPGGRRVYCLRCSPAGVGPREMRRVVLPERQCPYCKAKFTPWRRDQGYCSSLCGKRGRANAKAGAT